MGIYGLFNTQLDKTDQHNEDENQHTSVRISASSTGDE